MTLRSPRKRAISRRCRRSPATVGIAVRRRAPRTEHIPTEA